MSAHQPGILAPGPKLGRFLFFHLAPEEDAASAVDALSELDAADELVVGLGNSLVLAAGAAVDGLRPFPGMTGPGIEIPSTQAAAWCWLRGESDRGELVRRSLELEQALDPLELSHVVDGFQHDPTPSGLGRDLTGYEDGTENPEGDARLDAAIVSGGGRGLDGSSFAAVQKWQHDLVSFESMSQEERDHIIGRRRSDNEEIEDAPESAHVKRTAQESFDPEAFVVRQSMPWADPDGEGLLFVAFGRTLDAFEAQLTRMAGLEDGIVDGLFKFSRPVSGGYYWCPPINEAPGGADGGRLDLTLLAG